MHEYIYIEYLSFSIPSMGGGVGGGGAVKNQLPSFKATTCLSHDTNSDSTTTRGKGDS
jgi:hypothetical protein